jgi:twitching motility protein PilT
MIHTINMNEKAHIITIEDPIEFVHNNQSSLVSQREVDSHTKSFGNALRAALREDPDIILLGEMRDLETVSMAITAAETGHLVFGTLHTNSAIKTIDRVIDVFPEAQQTQIRVMLSESLRGRRRPGFAAASGPSGPRRSRRDSR